MLETEVVNTVSFSDMLRRVRTVPPVQTDAAKTVEALG
jgi:hypothetical protein